ncbi:MAG: hypothetical protein KatS3mg012_0535 [Gaiellaceae bacterium]|jgi:hypothetical protein|nr:MAG: hypothetical protein KatS3mg012_0535 [Gaiellaceae bacterium]
MRVRSVIAGTVALAAVLVAPAAFPSGTRGAAPTLERLPRAAAAGQLSQYGHIRSLTRVGPGFRLRFDPAFWLGGSTANRAAEEDGVIAPGEGVPNDYYVRDEARKLLTYRVPPSAKVTVLDRRLRPFSISVAQLAAVVAGRNPTGRPLYDRPRALGYWILVDTDRVLALDQQYQP